MLVIIQLGILCSTHIHMTYVAMVPGSTTQRLKTQHIIKPIFSKYNFASLYNGFIPIDSVQ